MSNIFKKLTSLALAGILAGSLAACGGATADSGNGSTEATGAKAAGADVASADTSDTVYRTLDEDVYCKG